MADDAMQASTGALQGGGGVPVQPQGPNQGILDKLLPIVIPALAGMATTNKWAGPGAAIARGATAGLAGYESQQPKALTPHDRAQMALAQHYETQNDIAQRKLRASDEYLNSLPPDERAKASVDLPGYVKFQREQALRQPNLEYLYQRYPDLFPPGSLDGRDNAHLMQLTNGLARDEFRAQQRGEKESKPTKGTAIIDPTDGHELQPNEDATKGVKVHVLRGSNGQVIPGSVGGIADKPKPSLTSATRTMLESAPRVIGFVDRIDKLVDENVEQLGPAKGRWSELWAGKIGATNEKFIKLRTDVGLMTTALMRMHVGARGGEYIMKHFQDLVDAGKQSPENMKAALGEIKSYAQDLERESKGEAPPPPEPSPTKTDLVVPGLDAAEISHLRSQGVSDDTIRSLGTGK